MTRWPRSPSRKLTQPPAVAEPVAEQVEPVAAPVTEPVAEPEPAELALAKAILHT